MKTLNYLTIVLLLFIFIDVESQSKPDRPASTIYLAYQPADHGVGVRGDYHLNYILGSYSSLTYGNWGAYDMVGFKNHFKATVGGMFNFSRYGGDYYRATVGFNYHYVETDDGSFAETIDYSPVSFEVGLTVTYEKFAIAFRTDVLHWEPCVDIGIPLRNPTMRERRNDVCNRY